MKWLPAMLGAFFIGCFRAFLNALQDCVSVQLGAFIIFHIATLLKLKNHEPVSVIGNNDSQFASVGNILRELKHFLGAVFSAETIALGNLDLTNIAQLTHCGAGLPVDMDFGLLVLLPRLLRSYAYRRCQSEIYRHQNKNY